MYLSTSTFSMTASLRRTLGLLQTDLARGQKEVSTLRHADLGSAILITQIVVINGYLP